MTKKEVQAIIAEVDSNRDGKLDYKEVLLLIMKYQVVITIYGIKDSFCISMAMRQNFA